MIHVETNVKLVVTSVVYHWIFLLLFTSIKGTQPSTLFLQNSRR